MRYPTTLPLVALLFGLVGINHSVAYPIEKLKSSGRYSTHLIAAKILKSEVKGGIIGEHKADGRVEQTVKILSVLKGSFKKGQTLVVAKALESYPIERERALQQAPQVGRTYLMRVEDQTVWAWKGWAQYDPRELQKDFQKDRYYLDFKTALARVAGSSETFRTKGPLMNQAEAERIAQEYLKKNITEIYGGPIKNWSWKVTNASLSEDEWSLGIDYWAEIDGQGRMGSSQSGIYIDAETGEVLGQIIAD